MFLEGECSILQQQVNFETNDTAALRREIDGNGNFVVFVGKNKTRK